MKEKPSLLKNIRTSWDIINLGWNVVRFRGGVERREAQLGRLSAKLVAEVEAGDIDPVVAEDKMSVAGRPQPVQEVMLTDSNAEKAGVRLSCLVESGHVDPVFAENLLDLGLNPHVLEKTLDNIKRTTS